MNFVETIQNETHPFCKNLKRKEYVEKAAEIIKKEGVEAVSIRRIAKELRCSTTAMYRHFNNLDELLFYAQLSALNTYIYNLQERESTWKSIWDTHFDIWELYADQAFRKPEAFELIFYKNVNKNLGSALKEYYEMFPEAVFNLTPLVKQMLEISGYYERDWCIVQHIVEKGYLSEENGRKVNHIECNLFLGYFKYVQETSVNEDEIPALVSQFIGEIKEIAAFYANSTNGENAKKCN